MANQSPPLNPRPEKSDISLLNRLLCDILNVSSILYPVLSPTIYLSRQAK